MNWPWTKPAVLTPAIGPLMLQADFDSFIKQFPAVAGEGFALMQDASVQRLSSWTVFQSYLQSVPPCPLPYDVTSWNCLAFARWVIAQMNAQWAKDRPGQPPAAWGIITGDVPLDGDSDEDGWHATIIAFCDAPYIGGAQDRVVKNASETANIKAVEFLIVGGG